MVQVHKRSIQPDTRKGNTRAPTQGYKGIQRDTKVETLARPLNAWAGSHHDASWSGDDHGSAGPQVDVIEE